MAGASTSIYIGIVDDDQSVCRSLGRLMRASGMHAITYLSAEDFLHDHKRPRFDCLVLDVRLGRMSGIALQQHLNASGDMTPVIFITAHDDPDARAQAERAGCVGFFRKTAPGETVLAAIRSTLADHHHLDGNN